ncbi:MAG: hypothetical protein ABEL97_07805 [Salinibacter sp.]
MPKKSDRSEHESTISSLMPDVSLDDSGQDAAEEELEFSSSKEEQNYSSTNQHQEAKENVEGKGQKDGSSSTVRRGPSEKEERIAVLPDHRPELAQKLGPYVSNEVDEALEEAFLLLRRRFGSQVSKSLIVEAALRYVLRDCLQRGEESEVADWMEGVLNSD